MSRTFGGEETSGGFASGGFAGAREVSRDLLLDELGQRLAFERSGVRLYEILLAKLRIEGALPAGPTAPELQRFRDEELSHIALLVRAIERHGGDPGARTPASRAAERTCNGILAVVADRRTNQWQSLEAMLGAELLDRDSWASLAALAEAASDAALAEACRCAEADEARHLEAVRRWVGTGGRAAARARPHAP
jgi:hypothetical protein